jgi:hypothetical protein
MWNLIHSAPPMDKEYTLYRFVDTDYLKHLKEGDVFSDPGFVSATRDPFYRSEYYKFGFILIKIRIPPMAGSCLSLEPWSHFALEQEMVLPPFTELKLLKRDRNAPYFHIDANYTKQVTTRYEFIMVKVNTPRIPEETKSAYQKIELTNLLKARITDSSEEGEYLNIHDRINHFHEHAVDKLGQLRIKIGKHVFLLLTEWYNSTISYKEFYAHMNKRGFSLYGFLEEQPDRILFFVEIVAELQELHVNWYFRWSDDSHLFRLITEQEFVDFLARLAYLFAVQRVIIYGRYRFCHTLGSAECSSGSYRADVYDYLKHGNMRFSFTTSDGTEPALKPQFGYLHLDQWKNTLAKEIVNVSDRDQFYQHVQQNPELTLAELYLETIEKYCSQISTLERKIDRLYQGSLQGFNPLAQLYWVLEPYEYLYSKKEIAVIPEEITLAPLVPITKISASKIDVEGTRMNRYRL